MLAYVAGVVAHPAYAQRFLEELQVPGVRVPLTADRVLWNEAVRLGREVLWLHTTVSDTSTRRQADLKDRRDCRRSADQGLW